MPVDVIRFDKGAPEDFGAPLHDTHGPPRLHLVIRPHQSLTPPGFVWFIGLTAGLLTLPLLMALGRPVLWGLLPFCLAAIAAIWWGLQRSWRDRALREDLVIWQGWMRLTHKAPGKAALVWQANPYWVRLRRIPEGAKVPDYLTLKAEGREVEIGAFLSPGERRELHALLEHELRIASRPVP